MKKTMNNVMRNAKNLIFDLFVIIGGLALIVIICKAVFNTDNKITTNKVEAAEIATDEAKYSETMTEIMDEIDDEFDEMLYGEGREESNKENIKYDKNVDYLGSGIYEVIYIFNIYGSDDLTYTAYVDAEEEDGFGVFTLKGIRVDEYILGDIYPEFFD